jgi:hypothetical protein
MSKEAGSEEQPAGVPTTSPAAGSKPLTLSSGERVTGRANFGWVVAVALASSGCASSGIVDLCRHTVGHPEGSLDPFDAAPSKSQVESALDYRWQVIRDGKVFELGPSDSDGRATSIPTWRGWETFLPEGRYLLRVSARCQPTFDVPFESLGGGLETRVVMRVPLPEPVRRWTKEGAVAKRLSRADPLPLPPNLEVEQVRAWPEAGSTACDTVVIRPVEPVGPARKGDLLIVGAAMLSDVKLDGPTAAEAAKLREAEEKAAQARARVAAEAADRAARDKEVATGRCDPARYAALQRAIGGARTFFEEALRGQVHFYFEAQDTVVATPQGTSVGLRAGARGEYHLFAIGFDDVALAAVDSKGYPVQQKSQYEFDLRSFVRGASTSSQVLQVNTRDQITVQVTGSGCAAVIAVGH